MRVYQSEDQEQKYVHCDEDNFMASFAFGEWSSYRTVDVTKLKELDPEDESYEVWLAVKQAKRALRYW